MNAPVENPEDTTEIFRQPDDEVEQVPEQRTRPLESDSIVVPFSCYYEGQWYREADRFQKGCEECQCRDRQGKGISGL